MDEPKQKCILKLISPQPRKTQVDLKVNSKRNPFHEKELPAIKSHFSNKDEDDQVLRELHSILSKSPCILPPIGKKPSWFKMPARVKGNPIIFDQKFQELNSTASSVLSAAEELPD